MKCDVAERFVCVCTVEWRHAEASVLHAIVIMDTFICSNNVTKTQIVLLTEKLCRP